MKLLDCLGEGVLNLVELEGHWHAELLLAYVVMIPEASGGDQRHITVLDVLYRL